jgi:hypothetical protein
MIKDLEKTKELLVAGAVTALFIGLLSFDAIASLRIALAYLVVIYLPGLFWVGLTRRSFLQKYVMLHVFGLVATPFLLYVISFVGPVNEATVIAVFLLLFLGGFLRYKKLVPKRGIDASRHNDSPEQ